jgi:hypothetical protein
VKQKYDFINVRCGSHLYDRHQQQDLCRGPDRGI